MSSAPKYLFRVGDEEREGFLPYNYFSTQFKVNDKPIYRCSRGNSRDDGKRLFLFKSQDQRWHAVEAPAESEDPPNEGTPVFRTEAEDIDDIAAPVDGVVWQWWNPKTREFEGAMKFTTHDIRECVGGGQAIVVDAEAAAAAGQGRVVGSEGEGAAAAAAAADLAAAPS